MVTEVITNTGGSPVVFGSVSLAGAAFALGTVGCSGVRLAAAASCTIAVLFASAGSAVPGKTGTLSVPHSGGGATSVALAGSAVAGPRSEERRVGRECIGWVAVGS